MVQIISKEAQDYKNKLKNEVALNKNLYDPKYIFKKLKDGFYLHEIIGFHIPVKYIAEIYKNTSDEDLYGESLYNGDSQSGQKGLRDYLGSENSMQRQDIDKAQDNRLENLKQQEGQTPEEENKPAQGAENMEEPEQKIDEEEPNKQKEPEEEEKKDNKEDATKKAAEDITKEQAPGEGVSTGAGEGMGVGTGGAGTTASSATGAGGAGVGAGAATGGAGTAAAAGGGAAATGAATAGGTAAAGGAVAAGGVPLAIIAIIIILLLVLIIIIGPLLKTGKFGHEDASAHENRGEYQTIASLSKQEELKKALDENIDTFIKKIENIKANTEGKNKETIIKLCDDILKDANELKGLPAGENASEEDKGKKEEIKVKIMGKVKELIPLINDIIGIAMREIGVCRGTKEFSTKRFNNGDAWCAAFVRYVYSKAGINLPNTDLAPNMYCEMQKNPDKYITFEAGKGTPQSGDIIFFGWGSIDSNYCNAEIQHVGIVVDYKGGNNIKTVEGNTSTEDGSSCVGIKNRNIQQTYGGSGARFFARVK